MQSRTSYFNKTVFFSDLRRFWPLTAGFTLVWLLILPLSRFTELAWDPHRSVWNIQRETLGITTVGGWPMALCFGILFAMAVFSYLTNPRATYGLHALSVRRETLYLTHYLAGLCCQLAPQLLAVLLTAAVLTPRGALTGSLPGLMLLGLVLPTLFYYSFGVFCMMFTGQILAAPVFYGVLNVLAAALEVLLRSVAGNFLYGWTDSSWLAVRFLSPPVEMLARDINAAESAGRLKINSLSVLFGYAAAGLAFVVLGLLACRVRRSEDTGTLVAIRWARPVFKYGVTFCAAMALGQLLYHIFFWQYSSEAALFPMLFCMAAAGLLGYFTAEMLLKKSFRVWKSGWRGAAAVTAALMALGVVLSLDLTGYERWSPEPDRIENAYVIFNVYSGDASAFVTVHEPETLALVVEAHRAIARAGRAGQTDGGSGYDGALLRSCMFEVHYQLKNGRTAVRRYDDILLRSSDANTPGTVTAALSSFYNANETSRARTIGYHRDILNGLQDLRLSGGTVYMERWQDAGYYVSDNIDLSPAQANAVYDAILRDVAAGRAKGSLFSDESGDTGVSLEMYGTYLPPENEFRQDRMEDGRVNIGLSPRITPRMTETLSTLVSFGVRQNASF